MEDQDQRRLTVYFNDGSNLTLEFPKQADNEAAAWLRLDDVLKNRFVLFEAEGTLHVIPFENIKYLRASPAPRSIQGYTYIKGVSVC